MEGPVSTPEKHTDTTQSSPTAPAAGSKKTERGPASRAGPRWLTPARRARQDPPHPPRHARWTGAELRSDADRQADAQDVGLEAVVVAVSHGVVELPLRVVTDGVVVDAQGQHGGVGVVVEVLDARGDFPALRHEHEAGRRRPHRGALG